MRKFILKHRRKNVTLILTYEEFRDRFQKEIYSASKNFVENNKSILPSFCKKDATEHDFWFDLRWNFNNYANCEYYIERIK